MLVVRAVVILFVLAFIYPNNINAQQQDYPFEGMWKGLLSQSDKNLMYEVVLKLYYETDSTLFGVSKIVTLTGNYAEFYVEGVHDSSRIEFKDIHLMKESGGSIKNPWCIKDYSAEVFTDGDVWRMSGEWENKNSAVVQSGSLGDGVFCQPGKFQLTKIRGYANDALKSSDKVRYFQGRLVDVQEVFEVESDTLLLHIIDNNQLDNDTVSIFYDKQLLVKQHGLTYNPLELEIVTQDNKEHLLIIFANNTGDIPPNTAAIYFYENGVRREIAIRSDSSRSAGVIFKKKKVSN